MSKLGDEAMQAYAREFREKKNTFDTSLRAALEVLVAGLRSEGVAGIQGPFPTAAPASPVCMGGTDLAHNAPHLSDFDPQWKPISPDQCDSCGQSMKHCKCGPCPIPASPASDICHWTKHETGWQRTGCGQWVVAYGHKFCMFCGRPIDPPLDPPPVEAPASPAKPQRMKANIGSGSCVECSVEHDRRVCCDNANFPCAPVCPTPDLSDYVPGLEDTVEHRASGLRGTVFGLEPGSSYLYVVLFGQQEGPPQRWHLNEVLFLDPAPLREGDFVEAVRNFRNYKRGWRYHLAGIGWETWAVENRRNLRLLCRGSRT